MKNMDKDPYLSELDAIDDFEGQPAEEATEVDGPTRLDVKVPPSASGGKAPSVKAPRPQMPPPPPSFDSPEGEEAPGEGLPPLEDFEAPSETAEAAPRTPVPAKDILELAPDLAVPLLVVMGRKSFTVQDLLELRLGQIMDLDRAPLEPVDLVAGGKLIGKGELVEVDGKIGVRVLKLFK